MTFSGVHTPPPGSEMERNTRNFLSNWLEMQCGTRYVCPSNLAWNAIWHTICFCFHSQILPALDVRLVWCGARRIYAFTSSTATMIRF